MVSNLRACHGAAPLGLFDGALPLASLRWPKEASAAARVARA
jgi:hypothetical protein